MDDKYSKTILSSVLAGMAISIGAAVNLSVDNRYLGAALFSIGLFCVCSFGWKLFTGQVCRVIGNHEVVNDLPIVWIGNLIGAALSALFIDGANPSIQYIAQALWEAKTNTDLFNLFFGGFCCNVLIYIAVEGYRRIDNALGKYLAILLGVMVFILCSFEHSVADMAYFFLAGCPTSWRGLGIVVIVTLGNLFGGIIISCLDREVTNNEQ